MIGDNKLTKDEREIITKYISKTLPIVKLTYQSGFLFTLTTFIDAADKSKNIEGGGRFLEIEYGIGGNTVAGKRNHKYPYNDGAQRAEQLKNKDGDIEWKVIEKILSDKTLLVLVEEAMQLNEQYTKNHQCKRSLINIIREKGEIEDWAIDLFVNNMTIVEDNGVIGQTAMTGFYMPTVLYAIFNNFIFSLGGDNHDDKTIGKNIKKIGGGDGKYIDRMAKIVLNETNKDLENEGGDAINEKEGLADIKKAISESSGAFNDEWNILKNLTEMSSMVVKNMGKKRIKNKGVRI